MSSPSISALSICAEFLLLRSEDPLADEIFLFATNASPEKMLPQFEPFQWMREDEKKECLESAKMILKVLRYLQIKVLENGETFESAKKKIDSSPLSTAQKNVVYKLYNEKVQKTKNKGRKANRSTTPQKTTRAASNEQKQPVKTEWVSKQDKNWTDDASKEYKSTHKEEKKTPEKKTLPKKENNTNWGEIWNQQKNEKAARGRQSNNRKNTPEKAQQQKRNRSDTPQQRPMNGKKQQISIASVLPQSQQTEATLKSALAGSANRSRSEPAAKRQVRFQDEQNAGLLGALAWNTEQSNNLIGAIAWNKEQNRGLVNALAWNNHQNRALVNALAWNQEAKKWGPDATPPAELKPSFKPSQPQPQQFEAPKAPQVEQYEAPKAPHVQQYEAPKAPQEPVAPVREIKPEPRTVSYDAPREYKPQLFSAPKPAEEIIYKNAWKPPRAAQAPRSPTGSPTRRPNYQAQITLQLIQKLDEAEQIEWNKRAPFTWKQYQTEKKIEEPEPQFEQTYCPPAPLSPNREYYNENGYYESEAPVKYALNRHIMLGARAASVPPTEKDQERVIAPKLQPRESPKSEASRGRLAASKYFETNNNDPKNSRWSSAGSTGSSMGRFSSTDNSSQGRSPSIGFTIETPEERAVKENTKKNERPGTIPEEPEVKNFDVVDWGAKWSPTAAAAPAETEWVAPQVSPTGINVPRQFSNLSTGSRQPSARTMSSQQSSPHISASMPRGSPMVSPNTSPHISASMPRGTPMVSPNASPNANACIPHSAMSTPQTVASMPSHISNRTASTMASQKDAPEQPWWKDTTGWQKKKEAAQEPPAATHDPKDYKFTNGSWQKQESAQIEPAPTYIIIPLQPKAEEPKQEEQSWESHWADSKAAKSEWWSDMQREDQAAADAEQQWIDYYNGYQYGYAEGTKQAGKVAEYKSVEKRVQWQDLTVKTEFTAAAENPATQKKIGSSGWIQPPPGIKRAPVRRAVNLLCKGEREGNVKEPFQTILYEPQELGFDKRTGEKAVDLFFPDFCRRRISVA